MILPVGRCGSGEPRSFRAAPRRFLPVALACLLAACADDAAGRPETLRPDPPARIVSMTPALTEILFALGLGDRVVGVTSYCDHPAEAARKPKIGGYVNPSVETVLSLEPDLALVSPAAGNREAALAVRRAGVRLEVVPAETLEDAFTAIDRVARICGVEARGGELVRDLRLRLDRASARVAGRPRVRVLFCVQLEPLVAAGRGTLPSELLALAGGTNVVDAERYPRLDIETVVAESPEVILHTRMDAPDGRADAGVVRFWSRWPSIPAVRDGRVRTIDGTTAMRAGPRVVDAVEHLARALHPSAFEPEPDSADAPGGAR